MKKFKLIKGYPGSPKLGEIWDINKFCSKFWPYDYPDYWEEIVEKDYEILSGRTHFPSGNTEIWSIKRLSDGVEFKIGDKVYWNWAFAKNKYFTIKSFNIIEDKLRFNTVEESGQNFIFELISKEYNLQHYKEPILTTEDGYECTLDDRVFGVLPKANWQTNYYGDEGIPVENLVNSGDGNCTKNTAWLYFKTKENAEKYIYENKPEFSRKQILDVISKISINEPYLFGFKYGRPVVCVDVFKLNLQL